MKMGSVVFGGVFLALVCTAGTVDIDALCPPRPETAAAFDPSAYPGSARPYREAAKMIYRYMTSLRGMTALVETGKPDQKYQHNAYVSKTHAAHVLAMLRWAKLEPEKRETAIRFAKASAEYLLGELEPADAPLAFWPPTYGRKPLAFDPKTDGSYEKCSMVGNEPEAAVKYRGEVMLVYPSDVGTAFVAYYEATKDARFLAAARGIAQTYLRMRREDGSWPLKMKLATGETVGENTLVPNRLLKFFERLYAVTGEAKWRTAADKVFAWLEAHPLTDWNWDGQFEDIKPEKPYQNPTKHNACDVMMYMLERFPGDADRLALCRRILEFCEKRFVVWKAPADHPTWPVPSVLEQYSCFAPIDSSAAKMIRAYVAMHRAEGRAEDLAKARALADSITRQQLPSGRVPTFWDIKSGINVERYDWLNCMAASAEALDAVAAASPSSDASSLRLGAPFADCMVLQRDRPVTVWGWAAPGETVTVTFAGQSVSATADAKGAWRVKLTPMPACREGRPLVVAAVASGNPTIRQSNNRTIVHDVLVGEVWLCSGQSNADCPIWGDNPRYRDGLGALTVEMTWKPTVRFVKVPRIAATEPKLDHETVWLRMTPTDLAHARYGILPSAMGTYFALELASALDVPIGLVDCTWGGTNIDAWTPRCGYAGHPELADVAALPLLDEAAFGAAKTNGVYRNKPFTNGWNQQPSALWNGMVAGYAPMTCRGLIWYQGCHNAYEYSRYADKMQALYDGWSRSFENPEMSIHFVQLAPWGDPIIPKIQMEQARFAAREPHATMAVINDVGNLEDIHPNDKRTVAKRLAVQALRCDYGWAWLKYLSPAFSSLSVEGDRVTMAFDEVEDFFLYNPALGDRSSGFEVAGADGIFHPAEIVNLSLFTNVVSRKVSFLGHIGGNRLVVRSDKVTHPKRVRYLHSRPWYGAIRNEVGLPLGAFAADVEPLTDEERLVRDFAVLRDREVICLTNGTYHITEAMARRMWLAPSNNQTGEKLVAFALGGKDRVMLDGGGSTFVIHGRVMPFAVTNCTRFTVRNLTITTAYPSCAGFTVESKDDEGFVIAFDAGICPYRVESGHLVFALDGHDVSTRDGRLSLHALDRMAVHYLMAPDSPGDKSSFPSTFVSAVPTELGGGRVRFRYVKDTHPKCVRLPYDVGEKVVVNLEEKRHRDAFFFEDCTNVAVENVTIRRFGGMGVVAQRCNGVKVDGLVVEPPEGECVSVTADVMQFVNCCGDVTVENCRSGYSLDDVINVHGNYLIVEAVSGREVALRTGHRSHEGFFPYRAGDALEFVAAHTREVRARARVVAWTPDPTDPARCRVTVDGDLPSLGADTLVENVTLNPDVTIRGNDFHDHPNLRLSGRGKLLVERNRISRCVSALVGMDLADYWYESGRIADLTIRDNDFIDCNRLGGSTFLEFGVSGWGADAPKIHGRIRLENNRFEGVRGTRCRVSGASDFTEE